jgi:hypothetical protein
MAKYKLLKSGAVLDTEQNCSFTDRSPFWEEYQEWLAAGNIPDPAETLAGVIAVKVLEVKAEANRRIIAIMPDWKQRNSLARAAELSRKEAKNTATPEEVAELDQLETTWAGIKLIRAASDAIEAEVAALVTIEAVEQYATANNLLWP